MRKAAVFIIFILSVFSNYAQKSALKIGSRPTIINPTAVLDIESTTKGLLPPRMTTTQRDAISLPAKGIFIYNTTTNCLEWYDGMVWKSGCAYTNYQKAIILTQIGNEGDSPNSVPSVITTDQLISIGITGVIASNQAAYRAYIDANPNLFSSPATLLEVQTMVTAVNSNLILIQIGNEGDSPNLVPSVVTTDQLTSIGITGVIASNQAAYRAYIDANPNSFSSPATMAEVQTMVTNFVNTSGGSAAVTAYSCSGASVGTLNVGSAVSSVTQTITATVTTVGSYSVSASANGVTFAASGTFAGTGAQNIVLIASGMPTAAGNNDFILNTNPTCSFSRQTDPFPMPSTITLAQNTSYFVTSIYDQDYLPYSLPTAAASTAASAADGATETTVDVQGSIPTTGIAIKIPVTVDGNNLGSGSGTLPAYSATITIPANMTQDGNSRDLTLSWSSQAYTSSTTTIVATISAVGATLNAKKLDINTGVGNDALGVLMGQFTYPYNSEGGTTKFSVRDIAGIPDRMFGVAQNTTDNLTNTHLMLYSPIMAEDGKIWLNNNLGAHYANINHASFNPSQQATNGNDYLAYGSLFQWGRRPDGHELINWASSTTGTRSAITTTKSDNPNDVLFIKAGSFPYDWRVRNDALWASVSSANNPCPSGFRVPLLNEYNPLITAAGITTQSTAINSILRLANYPFRDLLSGNFLTGGLRLWTGSTNSTDSYILNLSPPNNLITDYTPRSYGIGVRCIKN